MIKNYFKITIRSLVKSKTFVLINIMGMGVSLAMCIIAYLNYDYNNSYDEQHVNAESIYRVNFIREFQGYQAKNGIAPLPLGNMVRDKMAGVNHAIRYIPNGGNFRIGDELFNTSISYADEGFLELFTFPLKLGIAADFKDKSRIFISTELAVKYFGQEDALGKQITNVLDSGTREYIIAGVFEKMPHNSSFQFDAVTHFDNYLDLNPSVDENNWRYWCTLFLEVNNPEDISAVEADLQQYKEPQNKAKEDYQVSKFYLDPFVGMAVRAVKEDVNNHWFRSSLPMAAATSPAIMSGLLLLIAIFNFTNTSIAMSSRRLKEIGIRKVMGSKRKELIVQFLLENLFLCLLSGIIAILLAELLVPAYNNMWDFLSLDLNYLTNIGFLSFMFSLLLLAGLLAGIYPALYITKFEPTSILKGTFKFGGNNWVTKALLWAQFLITVNAIVMAVGFIQNAQYQKDFDLGFSTDNIVYSYVNGEDEFEAYKKELVNHPKIKAVSGTKHHIMSAAYGDPIKYEDILRDVTIFEVGFDYFEMMDIKLAEGRNFKEDSQTDINESIIVNQTFLNEFGWTKEDAIGKRVVWLDTVQLYVVGTVNDLYTSALWGELEPTMFRLNRKEEYSRILVKAANKDLREVNEYMERKWKEVFPNRIYFGEYMDEEMAGSTLVNKNILILFGFLGVIAALLSASGLFAMVSLNIIKRTKEIGVRKVLGASIGNIAKKLNQQFAVILLLASLGGSILSYFLLDILMGSIWEFYKKADLLTFVSGTLLIFGISLITVGFRIYKAASMNPVNTLRSE
ncbi:MAG: FtsX-like permease family protein [Bacteroidota bacterium]